MKFYDWASSNSKEILSYYQLQEVQFELGSYNTEHCIGNFKDFLRASEGAMIYCVQSHHPSSPYGDINNYKLGPLDLDNIAWIMFREAPQEEWGYTEMRIKKMTFTLIE